MARFGIHSASRVILAPMESVCCEVGPCNAMQAVTCPAPRGFPSAFIISPVSAVKPAHDMELAGRLRRAFRERFVERLAEIRTTVLKQNTANNVITLHQRAAYLLLQTLINKMVNRKPSRMVNLQTRWRDNLPCSYLALPDKNHNHTSNITDHLLPRGRGSPWPASETTCPPTCAFSVRRTPTRSIFVRKKTLIGAGKSKRSGYVGIMRLLRE